MSQPSRTVQRTWLVATIALWATWALLANHHSARPQIFGRWSMGYAALLGCFGFFALLVTAGLRPNLRAALWRRRTGLCALVLGTILSIGLAEWVLRKTDPVGISYFGEMTRYLHLRQPDPHLVYTQPRDQQHVLDGAHIRFNQLGLRGPEIGPKSAQQKRVLFLGDSVVFGWGVEETDAFAWKLTQQLSATTDQEWQCVNSGVCSYNTQQEAIYLEQHGMQLQPDLVVLVMIDNDVLSYAEKWDAQGAKRKLPLAHRLHEWLKHSHLFKLAQLTLNDGVGGVHTEGAERSVQAGDPGWDESMRAFEDMVERCRAADIPLAIFHFRWKAEEWSDRYLAAARVATGEVPIIDTAPWFQDAPLREWVNSRIDSHPNPQAHSRAAERMHEELKKQALLPR